MLRDNQDQVRKSALRTEAMSYLGNCIRQFDVAGFCSQDKTPESFQFVGRR